MKAGKTLKDIMEKVSTSLATTCLSYQKQGSAWPESLPWLSFFVTYNQGTDGTKVIDRGSLKCPLYS